MSYPEGCTVSLAAAFPVVIDGIPLVTPGQFALRALPGTLVLLAWLAVEAKPKRVPFAMDAKRQGAGIAMLASLTLGVLAWHSFDLFACYHALELEQWRYVGVFGAPLSAVAILIMGNCVPRLGILLAIAAAGATIVADWAVRSVAAVGAPFAAAGHIYLLVAAALIGYLPVRGSSVSSTRPWSRLWKRERSYSQDTILDPMASSADSTTSCQAPGAHSWFV